MKRVIVLLLLVIMIFSFTKCGFSVDGNFLPSSKNSQYILEPKTCMSLIGCTPQEAEQTLKDSYWVEGHFQSAIEDEEGNLILTLSQKDVEHWSGYINQLIKKRAELDTQDGCDFIVDNDYKCIESYVTKELYPAAGYNIVRISVFCGIMQMLNGNNPNDWYVDIKMYDVETEILVAETRFPDEKFEVSSEDWDAALNSLESAQ